MNTTLKISRTLVAGLSLASVLALAQHPGGRIGDTEKATPT